MIAIALVVLGIVFLCRKRIPYGKKRELRGPLVYLICMLMIVPPCIFLGWGVREGIDAANNNRELDEDKLIKFTLTVELPTYAGIFLLSWLLVATNARPVRSRRRRFEDDYDDYDDRRDNRDRRSRDDDDRPRRRDRNREYDDDDRDRDRERRRRRDNDDDGDRERDRRRRDDDDLDYRAR